ncbi:hypothetical protein FB474_1495 [Oryzihumus leptocrescens]|uniref:Uncharacterized protein n=1 Tax=Oryzihumus leptocrescens TaxID=297536 RepID=A0A542ZIC9_9MICO|nr:hypothetical protein FB474_1495 [Oryzihumus leptocrescens]
MHWRTSQVLAQKLSQLRGQRNAARPGPASPSTIRRWDPALRAALRAVLAHPTATRSRATQPRTHKRGGALEPPRNAPPRLLPRSPPQALATTEVRSGPAARNSSLHPADGAGFSTPRTRPPHPHRSGPKPSREALMVHAHTPRTHPCGGPIHRLTSWCRRPPPDRLGRLLRQRPVAVACRDGEAGRPPNGRRTGRRVRQNQVRLERLRGGGNCKAAPWHSRDLAPSPRGDPEGPTTPRGSAGVGSPKSVARMSLRAPTVRSSHGMAGSGWRVPPLDEGSRQGRP